MNSILLWPLLLYAAVVVFLLAVILLLSYMLGQHHAASGRPQSSFASTFNDQWHLLRPHSQELLDHQI